MTSKSFCIDENGKRHLAKETWKLNEMCSCTCLTSDAFEPMILCDTCSASSPKDTITKPKLPPTFGNLGPLTGKYDENLMPKHLKISLMMDQLAEEDSDCFYASNGIRYKSNEKWMSLERVCEICQCNFGYVHCEPMSRECPRVEKTCAKGEMLKTNSCCETRCLPANSTSNFENAPIIVNKSIQKDEVIARMNQSKQDCWLDEEAKYFLHGTVLSRFGYCVDEKCVCFSGQWKCSKACIGLFNDTISSPMISHIDTNCKREKKILWDPFCCPRCPGTKSCRVQDIDKTKAELVIKPGTRFVHKDGEGFCINGKVMQIKTGRAIRNQPGCWTGHSGYKDVGERWTHSSIPCLECYCDQEISTHVPQIACQQVSCPKSFVCLDNEVPFISEGQCCASRCIVKSIDYHTSLDDKIVTDRELESSLRTDTEEREDEEFDYNQATLDKFTTMKGFQDDQPDDKTPHQGCRPLNYEEKMDDFFIPLSSMQIVHTPCKNLLCKCTLAGKWLCTDYCPHCSDDIQDFDNVDQWQSNGLRDEQGCCVKCDSEVLWLRRPINMKDKVTLLSDKQDYQLMKQYTECRVENSQWKIISFVAFCLVGLFLGFFLFFLRKKCYSIATRNAKSPAWLKEQINEFINPKDATVVKCEVICRSDFYRRKRPNRPSEKKDKSQSNDNNTTSLINRKRSSSLTFTQNNKEKSISSIKNLSRQSISDLKIDQNKSNISIFRPD